MFVRHYLMMLEAEEWVMVKDFQETNQAEEKIVRVFKTHLDKKERMSKPTYSP